MINRLLAGVLPAMVVPFCGALVYFVLLDEGSGARVVYGLTKVIILIWPLIAMVAIEKHKVNLKVIDWARHLRAIWLGGLTGLVMAGGIVGLYELTAIGDYVGRYAEPLIRKARDLGIIEHYVLSAVWLSVMHSLLEEYYWRWYVFGRLDDALGGGGAYILASLSFAAHHYVILAKLFSGLGAVVFGTAVALGGLLWCWLFRRQKSLAGCWISHMLVDGAVMYIGYKVLSAG